MHSCRSIYISFNFKEKNTVFYFIDFISYKLKVYKQKILNIFEQIHLKAYLLIKSHLSKIFENFEVLNIKLVIFASNHIISSAINKKMTGHKKAEIIPSPSFRARNSFMMFLSVSYFLLIERANHIIPG